nr:hypothetical protein [Gordonia polyisoprenivorans]
MNVLVVVLAVVASVTAMVGTRAPAAAAPPPLASCAQPAGAQPTVMAPERLGVDKAGLDDAIAFAASRMRTHIQVFRNNCLIGSGPLNEVTGDVPWNLFSSTKSVISMLAGIAYTQHRLDLNASIAVSPAGRGRCRACTDHRRRSPHPDLRPVAVDPQ